MPETRYVACDDSEIAYQVVGDGPLDLVFVGGWFSHIDGRWEQPSFAHCLRKLASFSRLILFDRRGVGASGPGPPNPLAAVEEWRRDLDVVLDACGSKRAVLLTAADGGHMALMFAAASPQRCHSLVLFNCSARLLADPPDYPFGMSAEHLSTFLDNVEAGWGTGGMIDSWYPSYSGDEEFAAWWRRYQRLSGPPKTARRMAEVACKIDARAILGSVRVPTLVLHRADFPFVSVEHSRYLARHIPNARLEILPGVDGSIWCGDVDRAIDVLEAFVTGVVRGADPDRALGTVLFSDIVQSTEQLSRIGDRAWADLLDRHDRATHTCIHRYGGRYVKGTGDGALAVFSGVSQAVECALELCQRAVAIGLTLRCGAHTGDIQLRGQDLSGLTVHIGARLAQAANAGEVLVSKTVFDLSAGSVIRFRSRGHLTLKGVADSVLTYVAERG